MLRPWIIVAGTSCCLFVASFVASVVAVREPTPIELRSIVPSGPVEPRLEPGPAPAPEPESDPLKAWIVRRAAELASEQVGDQLGALGAQVQGTQVSESRFVLDAADRGLWVTQTEVRVPCRALDTAMTSLRQAAPGRPHHCERWVEATAQVLERHGVTAVSPREVLEQWGGDRSVRVLLVYAGWSLSAKDGEAARDAEPELLAAHPAPVFPRTAFPTSRRAALNAVYEDLALGPYYAER